jgi:hypothetical protein
LAGQPPESKSLHLTHGCVMSRDPLPPVLLGEVRALGFPLFLSCPVCNHSGKIAIDALAGLPNDMTVHDIGHSVRCTGCGRRGGASANPEARLWVAHLRLTGQRHRLPYWTPLMREDEDAAVLAEFAATRSGRQRCKPI